MKDKIKVYNFSTLEKITNYSPPSDATYTITQMREMADGG